MDQQPKIPTLKDSQKPAVKLRGLGAGLTLFERMKQFKKKDLAFIMAGLGTLFMAPLAEHFMMSPESADGQLSPGMSRGGGAFGDGRSPYERTDGIAAGGPTGGGSDVITPLNVRDPSALVMGFGAAQQPPTNSALSPTSPSARSDSELKDALAASARGVGAAAKKAALPVPKVSLGGSGLRGLGVAGGGSSASAGLSPISSNGLAPNHADSGGRLGRVTSAPGYKGVAARGPGMGGGSSIDALRKAADSAAGAMNRGGSASGDLSDAASQAIPGGGGFAGNGQGGAAPGDKAASGSQDKSAKNVGESLDFLKRKMQQEKDLELAYKKKEANDWGLQTALWRNKMIDTVVGEMGKTFSGMLGDGMKALITPESGSTPGFYCSSDGNKQFYKASDGYSIKSGLLFYNNAPVSGATGCVKSSVGGGGGEAPKPGDDKKPQGVSGTDGAYSGTVGAVPEINAIDRACKNWSLRSAKGAGATSAAGDGPATTAATNEDQAKWLMEAGPKLSALAEARFRLTGAMPADCKIDVVADDHFKSRRWATIGGDGATKGLTGAVSSLIDGHVVDKKTADAKTEEADGSIAQARKDHDAAGVHLTKAEELVKDNALSTTLPEYKDIVDDAASANGGITKLAASLRKLHEQLGDSLQRAEDAEKLGPEPTVDEPTVKQVTAVNDKVAALTVAIDKINGNPNQKPQVDQMPAIEPTQPGASKIQASAVQVKVRAANETVTAACKALGLGDDCAAPAVPASASADSGTPAPAADAVPGAKVIDANAKIKLIPEAVKAGRESQLGVLNGIKAGLPRVL